MAEHPALSKDNQALSSDDIIANFDDLHTPVNQRQVSIQPSPPPDGSRTLAGVGLE